VNGHQTIRYGLLFAGVGIISTTLRKTTPRLKTLLGQRLAYPAGIARSLCAYRSPQMKVACDQKVFQQRFLFVGASNTPVAGGGMKIAPDAKIDDGLLNVNLIGAVGLFRALLQLRRLCYGKHINHPQVRYLIANCLEIDAPAGLDVAIDGDLVGQTPARVVIQPKSLQVAVP
jgi:diacylglycerol kinase family enzyme